MAEGMPAGAGISSVKSGVKWYESQFSICQHTRPPFIRVNHDEILRISEASRHLPRHGQGGGSPGCAGQMHMPGALAP